MLNVTAALTVVAEEAHVVNELFAPAWTIGVGAFLFMMLMLAAMMSLTSVGRRHSAPVTEVDVRGAAGHTGHASGH